MLRGDLEARLNNLKSGKKIKVKDLEIIEKNQTCLAQWEMECECRERKQTMKQMACLKPEKPDIVTQNNPLVSSPLYPSLTGASGPLLNTCYQTPPPQPAQQAGPPPPPYQTRSVTRLQNQGGPATPMSPTNPFSHYPIAQSTPKPLACQWSNPDMDSMDGSLIQAPMIQVPGPDGHRGVVFRPWTATDIQQAASHLPDIKNGAAFGKEFLAFCKEFMPTGPEIHRLLVKHVGPSAFSKIRAVVTGQGSDSRHEAPDWDQADNVAYRAFVTAVCAAVVTAFPATVNMALINSTKQGRTEDVTSYYQRLVAAFQIHSGLEEPTDITNMTV
uniref:uncharacterized protein LOC120812267 n=1 Tax=Gasterosteus aculeatus aculeatus TaxID=481459 RepID=UPI001A999DD7|nr:uncharacterized protein LOC120812267 [Gasterosteus aculeatus aculeatus]XP_040024034.1 uncharacterized protein LOC120812267 [Gasterosteus aculeatus aculeatus]XP_040024035.1 uncharacterized protein LOC120812267 [Gasterosteus aculeatus aculeatus]